MVWAREVDHLDVKDLLLEVGGTPERDGELDAFEGGGLDLQNDLGQRVSLGIPM